MKQAAITGRPASVALAVLACALGLASPAAARTGGGELSPKLSELARPAVSDLPPARQARALDLPTEGPGSLLREGDRVLVDVSFDQGAIAALDELRAAGARVVSASRRYQTVTVSVAPDSLRDLPAVPGVGSVSENRAPIVYAEGAGAGSVGADCEGGSVISEGIEQLNVDDARGKYGVTGSGVTVGVLSDSYDKATMAANGTEPIATHAGDDVSSGDLPGAANPCSVSAQKTPVNVLEDFTGSQASDEGRAMLQIVHDVAPDAKLAFATAFKSETSFAQNIEKLAKSVGSGGAGADVIVDDVVWFGEPFFQDGPIAAAVDKVASEGVAYFSSAGNDNIFDSSNREIASWEAPSFRDAGSCPAAVQALSEANGTHCMNFKPSGGTDTDFGITVEPKETLTVDLQWAEPVNGVLTDLDAYLLDSSGKLIESEDSDNIGKTKRPIEVLQWENTASASQTVRLAINRFAGLTPRLKLALLQNGGGVSATEYPTSSGGDVVGPTIFGHTAAAGAISVAAIRYNTTTQPERFSSRGPVKHYFSPSGVPVPEEVISKPDITATDCGETTFFASKSGADWRFCGTSAAAPHAAGVAALQLDAKGSATVTQLRNAQTTTASPIGTVPFPATAVGAGLLNADKAVEKLLPASTVSITSHPPNRTNDTTPSFGFSASASTTCFIDGVSAGSCASPFTAAPLPDGPHTFKVEVSGGDSASFSFTVDTVAPTLSFTSLPGSVTGDATPTFGFSASEPSDFTCSVDKGAPKACASPYTTASLASGPHSLAIAGTDQAGNSSSAETQFTVDTTAPTVKFTSRPPERTVDSTPSFEFSASEPAAFTCSIDGATPQFCSSPSVAPVLGDGPHTFEVTARDLAGNAGTAAASFTVDTRRPQTFFSKHPRHVLRTHKRKARASFRFGSNEEGVTFICKVDGGLLRFCGNTLSRQFEEGKHLVLVKARDAVGNVDRTPAVFRFRVKRVG